MWRGHDWRRAGRVATGSRCIRANNNGEQHREGYKVRHQLTASSLLDCEDRRVRTLYQTTHDLATGPALWSSGEPKSSETTLPAATTIAVGKMLPPCARRRGYLTQLTLCNIRTSENLYDCDCATQSCMHKKSGYWICETTEGELDADTNEGGRLRGEQRMNGGT